MPQPQNKKSQTASVLRLIIAISICLGIGGLGAIATTPEIQGWYQTLTKPTWNPPPWIFGPVWTTLYILMGIAVWRVCDLASWRDTRLAIAIFSIQLFLNLAWSWIFFRWHLVGWAFVDLLLLWIAIVISMILFAKHSRLSALLLLPYLIWVSFAGYLNFTIWNLN